MRDLLTGEIGLEDPARAGLRRPQLCVRLAPPRRGRLRHPDVRRHRDHAHLITHHAREAVPRPAAGGRLAPHRRQPNRRRRPRLNRPAADLSRGPLREGRQGHRRHQRLGQPDQLRVSPRRRPGRRHGHRLRRETIVAVVTDEADRDIERLEAKSTGANKPLNFRFQFRPARKGSASTASARSRLQKQRDPNKQASSNLPTNKHLPTTARLIVVDQGSGLPGALRERTAQLGVQVPLAARWPMMNRSSSSA